METRTTDRQYHLVGAALASYGRGAWATVGQVARLAGVSIAATRAILAERVADHDAECRDRRLGHEAYRAIRCSAALGATIDHCVAAGDAY